MVASNVYLERCVNAVKEINPDWLTELEVGKCIGIGSMTVMHVLAEVPVGSQLMHLGLKIPTNPALCDAEARARMEICQATLVTNHIPELLPKFPAFLGVVATEATKTPIAVLTEDVSQGDSLPVLGTHLSKESTALFKKHFPDPEDEDELPLLTIDAEMLMAFRVGDQERFLDLFCDIVRWRKADKEGLEAVSEKVFEAGHKLHIDVPENSNIAQTIFEVRAKAQQKQK